MKNFLRAISLTLVLTLFVQIMPTSVLAADITGTTEPVSSNADNPPAASQDILYNTPEITDPQVVGEDESLRDSNVKHFRRDDGSFVAAVYSTPIHYKLNGKWEDIDNTLGLTKDENGKPVYKNKASNAKVSIPETLTDDSRISLSDGKNEIKFGILNAGKSIAAKITNQKDADTADSTVTGGKADGKGSITPPGKGMDKTGIANLSSKAEYKDVFASTDIDYQVTSTGIKESIIVNSQQNKYQYSFVLETNGLTAVKNEDNSISLYNGDSKDEIFVMDAPYMFDAAEETSNDVDVILKPQKENYIVTIDADKDWINSSERVWPVTIDPSVTLEFEDDQIHDAYVNRNQRYQSFPHDYTYVGNNTDGRTRTYIKFDLPPIPDCSIIIDANLRMLQDQYDPGTGPTAGAADNINVYEVESSGWDFNSITWDNQPFNENTNMGSKPIVDYCAYGNNTGDVYKWYYWNITSIVKNWYEDGSNKGLALISADESASEKTRFFSPSRYIQDQRTWPAVSLVYVNNNGLEDYWTYENVDLGRSGTAYVNDYNGNFVYTHSDFSMNGNLMPIDLTHVYTLDKINFDGFYGMMKFGIGFRLNVLEQIVATEITQYPYKLIDSDGTVHYYKSIQNQPNKYADEFNSKLILEKKLQNGSVTGYTLADDEGNVKRFSAGGFLTQLMDGNGNTQTINYVGDQITSITDGAGRSITLNYDDINVCLTSIVDYAGRTTSFSYTLVGIKDYYLNRITYPDGKYTRFYYNGGKIDKITTVDSTSLEISYKSFTNPNGLINRVSEVCKKGDQGTVENSLAFTYREGETDVSDNFDKTNCIMFDTAGRTVCVRDQAGQASYTSFNSTGNKANTVNTSSTMQAAVHNLAKNSSAEITDSTWYRYTASGGTGNTTVATNEHYLGNKSLKVESTASTGRIGYCQAFTGNPGTAYTFSGFMKIPTAINSATGGAFVGITYENNGSWYIKKGMFVTTQSSWGRYIATLSLPSTSSGSMGLVFCIENAVGTAYFDCAQMEDSWVVNKYNLLENDTFDRVSGTTPAGWTPQNCTASTDMAVSNWGGYGFKIAGVPGADKRIMQTVQVNGNAGDTIVFGAWGKADSSGQCNILNGERTYKLSLSIIYTDNTVTYTSVNFDPNVVTWQYVCGAITVAKACKSINYYLTYYDEVNSVMFEHAMLYIDNFGSRYEYNEDGRIEKCTSGIGEEINYTYNGPDIMSIQTKKGGVEQDNVDYTYDNKHNLLTETSQRGVKTTYTYNTDFNGNAGANSKGCQTKITVESYDHVYKSEVIFGYTSNFNYLSQVKDARGKITTYNYDEDKGLLNWVEDDEENTVNYTYDPNTDEQLSVSGNMVKYDDTTAVTNGYTYSNDRLSTVTHNNFNYGFTYDQFGRVLTSKVGTQTLVTNTYNGNGTLSKSTYGNDSAKHYDWVYDSLDRVTGEDYMGARKYTYAYNKDGELARETDVENGSKSWNYEYDLAGRINHTFGSDGTQLNYAYDEKGNTKTVLARNGSTTLSDAEYVYGTDNLLTQVKLKSMHNGTLDYIYDGINRLGSTEHIMMSSEPTVKFKTTNNYVMVGGNRTGLLAQIKYDKLDSNGTADRGKLNYTYDDLGNILTIREGEDNALKVTYHYDGLNQLIREDNKYFATPSNPDGNTITYTYDKGGNILTKNTYVYTDPSQDPTTTPTTINYSYDDTWKDKLTNYNDQNNPIGYDQIGNPINNYRGYSFDWQGRRLYSLSGNGITAASYKYNSSDLRTQKVSNGTTTNYTYAGNALISQSDGTDTLNYLYSPDGQMIGVSRNGYNYYYMYNVQGDVIALYNCYGDINSRYVYDSWGKLISVKSASGADISDDPTHIANVNPIRYRGYYYDKDTGFYYLQSRYYDPVVGRFLNADDESVLCTSPKALKDKNLFAYCDNNPIIRADDNGGCAQIVIGAAIGGIIGFVVSAVSQQLATGDVNWGVAGINALGGAASGALAATGIGIFASIGINSALGTGTYALEKKITGQEITKSGLIISGVAGGVCGAIGGKGVKGKELLGISKTAKQVLKTAVSPKKIAMYTAKQTAVKVTVAVASVRCFGGSATGSAINFVGNKLTANGFQIVNFR